MSKQNANLADPAPRDPERDAIHRLGAQRQNVSFKQGSELAEALWFRETGSMSLGSGAGQQPSKPI
jgi:hypothetical protein